MEMRTSGLVHLRQRHDWPCCDKDVSAGWGWEGLGAGGWGMQEEALSSMDSRACKK